MIGFFSPRYVKEGREMLKAARKMLNYKRDLLSPAQLAELEAEIDALESAIRGRRREEVAALSQKLDESFASHFPRPANAALRENCEVLFVALIITVGIRSFFLQPFTIPTGSMQPTLNGIRSYLTEEAPPNAMVRMLHSALYGRSYVNIVSEKDDTIQGVRPVKRFIFLNYSEVRCKEQRFLVHVPPDKLENDFKVRPGRPIKKGEIVARGYVNTGDHVFVDKVSYHFRNPDRGEVFVFNTLGIATYENITNPGGPSQYYIKRLAGLPGDRLRIDPPLLFINGEVAKAAPFQRVMSEEGEYQGYSNSAANGVHFPILGSPTATFVLPEKSYFALGDNSYNSSDSRAWGVVPEKNVMGRGLFVYWPFTSHWGLIK